MKIFKYEHVFLVINACHDEMLEFFNFTNDKFDTAEQFRKRDVKNLIFN